MQKNTAEQLGTRGDDLKRTKGSADLIVGVEVQQKILSQEAEQDFLETLVENDWWQLLGHEGCDSQVVDIQWSFEGLVVQVVLFNDLDLHDLGHLGLLFLL